MRRHASAQHAVIMMQCHSGERKHALNGTGRVGALGHGAGALHHHRAIQVLHASLWMGTGDESACVRGGGVGGTETRRGACDGMGDRYILDEMHERCNVNRYMLDC